MNYSCRHLISPFFLNCQVILKQSTLPKSKQQNTKRSFHDLEVNQINGSKHISAISSELNKSWCPYIPLSTSFPRLRFACVFQHHLVASVPPIMGSFGYLKKRLIQFETQLLNPGSCTSIDQHLP